MRMSVFDVKNHEHLIIPLYWLQKHVGLTTLFLKVFLVYFQNQNIFYNTLVFMTFYFTFQLALAIKTRATRLNSYYKSYFRREHFQL